MPYDSRQARHAVRSVESGHDPTRAAASGARPRDPRGTGRDRLRAARQHRAAQHQVRPARLPLPGRPAHAARPLPELDPPGQRRRRRLARHVVTTGSQPTTPHVRITGLARRPPPSAAGSLPRFRERAAGLLAERGWKISAATAASSLALWLVLLASVRGVGLSQSEAPWQTTFAAFAFVRLLTVLPVTPGGAGIADLGLVGILAAGADHRVAGQVRRVLLFRAVTYLAPIPVGALAASRGGTRPRSGAEIPFRDDSPQTGEVYGLHPAPGRLPGICAMPGCRCPTLLAVRVSVPSTKAWASSESRRLRALAESRKSLKAWSMSRPRRSASFPLACSMTTRLFKAVC